jgi:predicted RNA polymerase sigma factor
VDLSNEAIRVTRLLFQLLPNESEVGGLLALMLLTDARRGARTGPDGELIPLDEQDRAKWDRARISEGTRILERALLLNNAGPYQIQAAIAALHDEAESNDATDWVQIFGLYESLLQFSDGPMARLSRTIALAMVEGPTAGLAALDDIPVDPQSRNAALSAACAGTGPSESGAVPYDYGCRSHAASSRRPCGSDRADRSATDRQRTRCRRTLRA